MLDVDEKNLLKYCLNKFAPYLVEKLDQLDNGQLSKEIIKEMRFSVISEQASSGFNEKWELNEYGKRLERFIEKLGNYLWATKETNYPNFNE